MKSLHTRNSMKSHNIVSKKRIMQSLYTRFCKAETRSKKTKTRSKRTKTRSKIENIWSFRILIDLIFWQSLIKSKKFEFAFFASMHVFYIDFSIVFSFAHFVDIFYKFFTIKLHKYRFIDVAKNIWKFWNSQWCYMMWFAFSFVIAKLKQLIFVSWCIF